MIVTTVSTIFKGRDSSYIYIWVSKKAKVIYVGMTNSRLGTLGRAGQHLDSKGTLRINFERVVGHSIDYTSDFILLTYRLPQNKVFLTVEKSYREGVEFLVQKELLKRRGTFSPTFDIVSWVRVSPRINNGIIRSIADDIINSFIAIYPNL